MHNLCSRLFWKTFFNRWLSINYGMAIAMNIWPSYPQCLRICHDRRHFSTNPSIISSKFPRQLSIKNQYNKWYIIIKKITLYRVSGENCNHKISLNYPQNPIQKCIWKFSSLFLLYTGNFLEIFTFIFLFQFFFVWPKRMRQKSSWFSLIII